MRTAIGQLPPLVATDGPLVDDGAEPEFELSVDPVVLVLPELLELVVVDPDPVECVE